MVEMNQDLHDKIVDGYENDEFWKRISRQLNDNKSLGDNAVQLPFIYGRQLPGADSDPYFLPRPENIDNDNDVNDIDKDLVKVNTTEENTSSTANSQMPINSLLAISSKMLNLIFHVDKATGIQRLYIPTNVIKDIFIIAYRNGISHLGFQRYYEIVTSAWYIHRASYHLIQFIRHCPQCQLF